MFSNNIQAFILFNIYVLIVVDIGILVTIYYLIVKTKLVQKDTVKQEVN